MKRFTLFLLLLLTSLRLMASAAGVSLNGVEVPGKKVHYAASYRTSETPWLLAETNPTEESEEDPNEGIHPAGLPALASWVFGPVLTGSAFFPTTPALPAVTARPLFLLFQNFRI